MVKKNNENGHKRSWTVIDGEKRWDKNGNGMITVTGQNQDEIS